MNEARSHKPRIPIPGVAWLLLASIVGFSIGAPGFAWGANVSNITQQGTVLLLLALPMTLIIMAEGLDLSMGSSLSLCTVVLAATSLATGSLALGIAAAIVTATLIGVLNGAPKTRTSLAEARSGPSLSTISQCHASMSRITP